VSFLCQGLVSGLRGVWEFFFLHLEGQTWPQVIYSALDAEPAFDPQPYALSQVHWSMLIPWPPYFGELAGWLAMLVLFTGLVVLKITNSTRYANNLTALCSTVTCVVNAIGAIGYATLGEVGASLNPKPETLNPECDWGYRLRDSWRGGSMSSR
jgi:hypothetical protein